MTDTGKTFSTAWDAITDTPEEAAGRGVGPPGFIRELDFEHPGSQSFDNGPDLAPQQARLGAVSLARTPGQKNRLRSAAMIQESAVSRPRRCLVRARAACRRPAAVQQPPRA